MQKAALGELITTKPRDLKAATAALIKDLREEGAIPDKKEAPARDDRGQYIRDKVQDARETRGETRSSASISASEPKPTGSDFSSGKLFDRLSAKYQKS